MAGPISRGRGATTHPGRATIRDVAAAAGVSVTSVSRVLNGGQYISSDLHVRIMRAVEELGFEPDVAAQAMRSRSTNTVGCMVSDIANPLYAEIVNAAEEQFQAAGYTMMLGSTRHDERREAAFLSALRRRRMDGMLVMAGENGHARVMEAIDGLGVPRIGIDRLLPGTQSVCADHRNGAAQATRYLIELGHRRIALLMGSSTMLPGAERLAGYTRAHQDAALPVDPALVRPQTLSTSFAFSEVCQLLEMEDRPTAVITLGTHMLAGVMEAMRSFGLRIPADVSVISVGDTDLARHATPSITALTWDLGELGRVGARLMLEMLGGKEQTPGGRVMLPTRLVTRESCAPPRG